MNYVPKYKRGEVIHADDGYNKGKGGEIIEIHVDYVESNKKSKNVIKYLVKVDGDNSCYIEEKDAFLLTNEYELEKFLIDIMLTNRNKYPKIIDTTIGRIDLEWLKNKQN